MRRILALAICLASSALLLASSAGAKTVELHSFSSSFNGSDANGGPPLATNDLDDLVVNDETGDVLVATGSAIYKFDSTGASQPFSALAPATVIGSAGIFSPITGAFAIDNSGGSTQGRFYAFSEEQPMRAYESSGSPIGSPFPIPKTGDNCGVAVDANGNVWRQAYNGPITEYGPDGQPTGSTVNLSGNRSFCAFEMDAQGDFYAPSSYSGGPVSKYAPDGSLLELVDGTGAVGIAVDRSTGDVYVDTMDAIDHYNAAGEYVESFGHLIGSYGVAVDSKTHAVYALENGSSASVEKFTSSGAVSVADVTTEAPTNVARDGATVHGKLNPEGSATTDCTFEYGTVQSGKMLETESCAEGDVFTGNAETAVSAVIENPNVQTDTEYQYRLRITNANGPSYGKVQRFRTLKAVKGTETTDATGIDPTHATLNGSLDPEGIETRFYFEWGTGPSYGKIAPTEPPGGASAGAGFGARTVSTGLQGLTAGQTYHYRLVATNVFGTSFGGDKSFIPGAEPSISADRATEINTDTALLSAVINPNGRETTYHWEYGTEDCSVATCQQTAVVSLEGAPTDVPVQVTLEGLTPGTTYHFRLIAGNALGTNTRSDQTFITYTPESGADACPNVLVRKQTGASATRHCRAYELVSAADTGGNDVESNLITGLSPLPGFPTADGKVLYTVRFGSVPGLGNPPNKGGDPYLATRGENGWTTKYVGLQANETESSQSFASTLLEADQGLDSFAFGGPEICDPCFPDGSRNIPLRLPDGSLVKGMAGSDNPVAEPAGQIAQSFSADGSSFVFGSTAEFEPDSNQGGLTIYERDLGANTTKIVSTAPDGTTMTGSNIVELGVSADGSRVLIGRETGTDAAGNPEYDLYMHIGDDPHSVPITAPTDDVLFAGMTADGSTVFFTTADNLADDSDAGGDLFRAEVGSSAATVTRVSVGDGGSGNANGCDPVAGADGDHWNEPGASSAATCGVVAISGGGGVASSSGTVYFLSPEVLDAGSDAVADQPNLYLAEPGSEPQFVATLDADNPAVRDAVAVAAERETADFQTTPDGKFAVFANGSPLTAKTTAGHTEIYRSEVGGLLACVSCLPSNGAPSSDTVLTKDGLNLADDGRVFFTTAEQLVLRDTNQLKDAYEWDEGIAAPISTGLNNSDSGLLTASADGKDVLFFTRQTLAPQDENGGAMKIYDAREGGGFLYNPPPRPCVASDECHGPGTQQGPPPAINSIEGTGEPQAPTAKAEPKPKHCGKGKVKRNGKCVKAHKHDHRSKSHSQRKEPHHG